MCSSSYQGACVRVDLGAQTYDILIDDGLIGRAGEAIAKLFPKGRTLIVSDENVGKLYLTTLQESLAEHDLQSEVLILPHGEKTKSWTYVQDVVDRALALRLERSDFIIALGGGVIGDLAGFSASITRRGMACVQIPTSLLAQVDSSVGGKTGINSAHGKNLIGAFHQPRLVLADSAVLDTLSAREFKAGYAEMVKYALINDLSFFEWLETHHEAIFKGGQKRIEAIATCCRAKASIVAKDEREKGERALLNLGHTFGHALEGLTQYDGQRLVHGEAVSIGIMLALRFSERLNFIDRASIDRVQSHFDRVGLRSSMNDIDGDLGDAEQFLSFIEQDKKVSGGRLTFILAKGIGQSFIAHDVARADVLAFLKDVYIHLESYEDAS